jgi:hypothetical protein
MTIILGKISRALFYVATFSGILFSSKSFSDAKDPTTLKIQAENFAVLKFSELILNEDSELHLIQPREDAIAFIIVENGPVQISGNLKANGKIFLISNSFLFKTARISANEVILCNYFPVNQEFWKENPILLKRQGPGTLLLEKDTNITSESFITILGDFPPTSPQFNPYSKELITALRVPFDRNTPNHYNSIQCEFIEGAEFLKILLPKATFESSAQ